MAPQTTLGKYALCKVYVNDRLAVEETNVTIKRESRTTEVDTVNKGLSGGSQGSGRMTITLDSAVPAAGIEHDLGDYIANVVDSSGGFPRITITGNGNKTLVTQGMAMDDDLSHGVDQNAKQTVNFTCQMAQWI